MINLYYCSLQNLFLLQITATKSRNYLPFHFISITKFSFQIPMLLYSFMRFSLTFTYFQVALKTSIENIDFFRYWYNKNFGSLLFKIKRFNPY